MSDASAALTENGHRVLEAIYGPFRVGGEWPQFGALDRRLHRENIDVLEELQVMLPRWVRADRSQLTAQQPDTELALWMSGIAQCNDSGDDVERFLAALRWMAEVESSFNPPVDDPTALATVSEKMLLDHMTIDWGYFPIHTAKVGRLLNFEPPGIWSQFATTPEGWQITLRREIRQYASVSTLPAYLATIEEQAPDFFGSQGLTPIGRVVRSLKGRPRTSNAQGADPYVFVIMPFGETWSDASYAMIRRVGKGPLKDLNLTIERADEIADPGRITDQILGAIERADAVIADITGVTPESKSNHPNSNVMWELGYAHAMAKPLVIMNQEPSESPFDLKDYRQVHYDATPTPDQEKTLARHVRRALDVGSTG